MTNKKIWSWMKLENVWASRSSVEWAWRVRKLQWSETKGKTSHKHTPWGTLTTLFPPLLNLLTFPSGLLNLLHSLLVCSPPLFNLQPSIPPSFIQPPTILFTFYHSLLIQLLFLFFLFNFFCLPPTPSIFWLLCISSLSSCSLSKSYVSFL